MIKTLISQRPHRISFRNMTINHRSTRNRAKRGAFNHNVELLAQKNHFKDTPHNGYMFYAQSATVFAKSKD